MLFCVGLVSNAQTARIKGIILDKNNKPVEGVSINYQEKGTITNENGFYLLTIPANQKITLVFYPANKLIAQLLVFLHLAFCF